jgi:O-antigen/teichoic acid export membrane protein
MIQAVTSLFVNVAKIALAIAGTGAWALVEPNELYGVLFLVIVGWVTPFRPRLRFVWREIRGYVSFGVRAAASTIMMEASRNLDYFLVGKFLGLSALGVYRVAFEVAMMPMETLSQTTYRVAYPVFSRVSAEWGRLEAAFFDTARMLLSVTGPIAVVVFFGAADLLRLIAGDKWLDAVPAIQVLALAGVLRTAERLFTRLFNAVGKPGLTVLETLATLVVLGGLMTALLLTIGESVGVLAVCYAWVASYPLLFVIARGLARSVMPFHFAKYARHLAPTAACVAIMAALTAAAMALRPATGPAASPAAGLLLVAGVGLGSYVVALRGITGLRLRDAFK